MTLTVCTVVFGNFVWPARSTRGQKSRRANVWRTITWIALPYLLASSGFHVIFASRTNARPIAVITEWRCTGTGLICFIFRLLVNRTAQTSVTPAARRLCRRRVIMAFCATSYNVFIYICRIILRLWRHISVSVWKPISLLICSFDAIFLSEVSDWLTLLVVLVCIQIFSLRARNARSRVKLCSFRPWRANAVLSVFIHDGRWCAFTGALIRSVSEGAIVANAILTVFLWLTQPFSWRRHLRF